MDAEDKAGVTIRYGSQDRNVAFINESGLYCLILSGKIPAAKRFRQRVTAEVLPGIRKRGKGSRLGQKSRLKILLLRWYI